MSDRDREAMKAFMSEIFCQLEQAARNPARASGNATTTGASSRSWSTSRRRLWTGTSPGCVGWASTTMRPHSTFGRPPTAESPGCAGSAGNRGGDAMSWNDDVLYQCLWRRDPDEADAM
jgi:hypothetical protein